MLPAPARLRHRPDFADTIGRGRRAGRPTLVLSLRTPPPAGPAEVAPPARVGFVVGRRSGGAVVRNRLRRRLRHLLAERYARLPPGSRLVLRALPGAERLSYAELAGEVDRLLERVLR